MTSPLLGVGTIATKELPDVAAIGRNLVTNIFSNQLPVAFSSKANGLSRVSGIGELFSKLAWCYNKDQIYKSKHKYFLLKYLLGFNI